MMFGTVMMSNNTTNMPNQTGSGQNNNNTNNNNTNLLMTTVPMNGSTTNGHITTISHMISSKYPGTNDLTGSDTTTDLSDKTTGVMINAYKSHYSTHVNAQQRLTSKNQSFDQMSVSSHVQHKSSRLMNGGGSMTSSMIGKSMTEASSQNQHSPGALQRQVNFNDPYRTSMKNSIYDKVNKHESNSIKPVANEPPLPQNDDDDEETNEQKIQVQILPQDDNWGENTTAVTADLSDFNDDMTEDGRSSRFNFNPKMAMIEQDYDKGLLSMIRLFVRSYLTFIFTVSIMFSSFVTPILFITLPRLEIKPEWILNECGLECEGVLIGISFKMFIILLGYWAIFLNKSRNKLPRVYELKALLIFVLFIMTFSYWLFYTVRIIDANVSDYYKILQFTVSYVDVLLFIFVISVFIMELRHLKPQYVVRVIRSPDGEQMEYDLGNMSIQRAAVFILEQYYKDFKVYNSWLETAHRKRTAQIVQLNEMNNKKRARASASSLALSSSRRMNDMENSQCPDNFDTESTYRQKGSLSKSSMSRKQQQQVNNNQSRTNNIVTSLVGANLTPNDRMYEEYEYERRLKKRKARLITTTEEAFTHIKRIQSELDSDMMNDDDYDSALNNNGSSSQKPVMDPIEAAQAIFTTIARDLRRYLRLTRQQPYFTRENIVSHLANCISYDVSPKAFLQKYMSGESLLFNEKALINPFNQHQLEAMHQQAGGHKHIQANKNNNNFSTSLRTLDQTWILISDNALYQNIEDNLMIVLKQNDVTLMCNFKKLPRFKLIEDVLDPKRNKFVLKLNSETTV